MSGVTVYAGTVVAVLAASVISWGIGELIERWQKRRKIAQIQASPEIAKLRADSAEAMLLTHTLRTQTARQEVRQLIHQNGVG